MFSTEVKIKAETAEVKCSTAAAPHPAAEDSEADVEVKLEPKAEEHADACAGDFNEDGALDLTLPKSGASACNTDKAGTSSLQPANSAAAASSSASASASTSGAAAAAKVPMNLDDLEALIDDTVRRGVLSYEADTPHPPSAPATPSKANAANSSRAHAHTATPTGIKHSTPPEEAKFPLKPIPKGALELPSTCSFENSLFSTHTVLC